MTAAMESIEISGFRSIAHLKLEISSPVTLIIGANGAGKSNVVDAFELLGYTVDGGLQAHILRSGGFSSIVHRSPAGLSESVGVKAWGNWNTSYAGTYRNGYQMRLIPGPDDAALLEEQTFTQKDTYDSPFENDLGLARESKLRDVASFHAANRYLLEVMSGCRVFHFDDTSYSAPQLRRSSVADNETLHHDARNVAAVLLDMRQNHPANYMRVLRSVQNVAPFFEDFVLRPEGDFVLLRWRQYGLDDVFSGSALSSGTLRFVSLAVLTQQPRPPATIVLDEPELGLHPAAIHQLADLLRSVSTTSRVVAATQSVSLLAQFTIDEVAIVERFEGSTTVTRPDREQLGGWIAEYSVGELWERNLLGGRPGGGRPLIAKAPDS